MVITQFTFLEEGGGIGVTERAAYILRVRELAVAIAHAHVGATDKQSAEA